MTDQTDAPGLLAGAEQTLARLDKMCCEPGRSPRLAAIAGDLADARVKFDLFDGNPADADEIVTLLEGTGGRIGRLQVGCCAPARMPLYADLLTSLTELQRHANAQVGRGH